MTDTALAALCATWQELLGLRDWTITIDPPHAYRMGRGERTGEVQIFIATRHARLSVLPTEACDPESLPTPDVEEGLVHELLHIHLALWDETPPDPKGYAIEQAINAVAHALVTLRRREAPAISVLPFGRCPHAGSTPPPPTEIVNGMQLCYRCLRAAAALFYHGQLVSQ